MVYRCMLRSTNNTLNRGGDTIYQINLPPEIWKKIDWKLNDILKVDIVKSGMKHSLHIVSDD